MNKVFQLFWKRKLLALETWSLITFFTKSTCLYFVYLEYISSSSYFFFIKMIENDGLRLCGSNCGMFSCILGCLSTSSFTLENFQPLSIGILPILAFLYSFPILIYSCFRSFLLKVWSSYQYWSANFFYQSIMN